MITVTDQAIDRIKEVSKKKKQSKVFFRVSISGGGCQGFQYNFKFEEEVNSDDQVFNFKNVQILVDKISLDILKGSKIDFVNDMVGSYFKIENPKASSTCGCGTSFSI